MNRRKFLSWVGIGGLATYLPVALVACSPQTENNSTSDSNETSSSGDTEKPTIEGFTTIASVQELDEQGQIVQKENEVIIFRDPGTSAVVALNSICTHQGCTVKWKEDKANLNCSCHDTDFGIDGQVIKGPANEPLAPYEVKEQDGYIFVKLT